MYPLHLLSITVLAKTKGGFYLYTERADFICTQTPRIIYVDLFLKMHVRVLKTAAFHSSFVIKVQYFLTTEYNYSGLTGYEE